MKNSLHAQHWCAAVMFLGTPLALADAVEAVSVPSRSALYFDFNQAGARATGSFERFDVRLHLSKDDGEPEFLEVTVHVDSLNTRDGERDRMLKSGYFFDVRAHPSASFQSTDIVRTGDHYVANGELEIRGVSVSVQLPFEVTRTPDDIGISGQIQIGRLDFGIGQGEWGDTTWIRNQVRVRYDVGLEVSVRDDI